MRSLDSEKAQFLRVCVWSVLAILLAALRFLPEDVLHVVLSGGAIFMVLAAAFGAPQIDPWMNAKGLAFFAVATMVVALITGTLIFGWWGIALMLTALVTFLLSARIAAR